MAKKGKKGSYSFKLGPKASIFYDPQSQVKVLPNKITEFSGRMTPRLTIALQNGHIVNLDKEEKADLQDKLDDGQPIFENMNKGDLVSYYEKTYDVSDAEVADFAKKKKDSMAEYLEELAADEADDNND